MKFIVITSPEFIPGEAFFIRRLFDCGLDILHLRKPGSSVTGCAQLLDALPAEVRRRIVTHDHFSLCGDYGLFGVHLNCRNPAVPSGLCPASVSASCHSVAEVRQRKTGCDYVFMSPVFDSISKRHDRQSCHGSWRCLARQYRGVEEMGVRRCGISR